MANAIELRLNTGSHCYLKSSVLRAIRRAHAYRTLYKQTHEYGAQI